MITFSLHYIKFLRFFFIFGISFLLIDDLFAQEKKWSYSLLLGTDFYSSFYDKGEIQDLPFKERISTNIGLGMLLSKTNISRVAIKQFGFYYKYRAFLVEMEVNNLDSYYQDYLYQIKPIYHIIGFPFFIDWKIYRGKNFMLNAKTGVAFEICTYWHEESVLFDGSAHDSFRLIYDHRNVKAGLPVYLGLGPEFRLSSKLSLAIYPSMNFYIDHYNEDSESGFSDLYGINLFLTRQ